MPTANARIEGYLEKKSIHAMVPLEIEEELMIDQS